MGTYLNYHGCLFVKFHINNVNGNDVVLTREEALSLYRQLEIALQQNVDPRKPPKKAAKDVKPATTVTVTKKPANTAGS
jgi:hypothetical protein